MTFAKRNFNGIFQLNLPWPEDRRILVAPVRLASLIQSTAAKLLVLLFLFCLNTFGRYPGNAGWDSNYQYFQASSGHYNDWHPPVMAWLWSYLDFVVPGKGGMLLFHMFLYWFGFGLIALAFDRWNRNRAAWAIILLAASPAFWMLNVQLFKDVGLTVSALSAFAIVFWFRSRQQPIPKSLLLISLLLLIYATLVRANGIIATAPLFLFAVYPSILFKPVRFLIVCIPILLLSFPLASIINHKIIGATPTHPIRSLQLFDVVGTAYYSRDVTLIGIDKALSLKNIDECYSPVLWDTLSPKARCKYFWDLLATTPSVQEGRNPETAWYLDPSNEQLSQLWIASILHHPLAYLKHRLIHFNYELGFIAPRHLSDKWVLNQIVYNGPEKTEKVDTITKKIFDAMKFNPIFSAPFCLVVAVMVLICASRIIYTQHNNSSTPTNGIIAGILAICYSGMLYCLGFLLIGVADEDRYQFWMILSILLSALLLWFATESTSVLSRKKFVNIGILSTSFVVVLIAQITCGDALSGAEKFNFDRVNLAKLTVSVPGMPPK